MSRREYIIKNSSYLSKQSKIHIINIIKTHGEISAIKFNDVLIYADINLDKLSDEIIEQIYLIVLNRKNTLS